MRVRTGVVGGGVAVSLAVLAVLAGCTPAGRVPASQSSESPQVAAGVGVPPPVGPGMTTLVVATRVFGSSDVGSFMAYPGDLWIRGTCAGGALELHLIPLAVLPIDCDRLGDRPFTNQITLRHERSMSLSVAAPRSVVWGVRVEQDQRPTGSAFPS